MYGSASWPWFESSRSIKNNILDRPDMALQLGLCDKMQACSTQGLNFDLLLLDHIGKHRWAQWTFLLAPSLSAQFKTLRMERNIDIYNTTRSRESDNTTGVYCTLHLCDGSPYTIIYQGVGLLLSLGKLHTQIKNEEGNGKPQRL